ncbi:cob(I)yrinic acid a,c-diamide adenosyltransferase [Glaciecola sp. MF2-115]|uniref:cob(I)yrinic acid a,c-diamide adenosyltransferase n=1 Tax=Glaciecola sp. MF2-115 TaxID=3384827 RepID=UPI0039A270A8
MKIYTKTGDKGTTQVYTSEVLRLSKDDAILECYGTIDELNSHVGMLNALLVDSGHNNSDALSASFMYEIQKTLFSIGFAISDKPQIDASATTIIEEAIDNLQQNLPAQTKFILPGGGQLAAQAHICRTVARRAERSLVSVSKQQNVPEICIQYLNRLSDYFFVAARALNYNSNIPDIEV